MSRRIGVFLLVLMTVALVGCHHKVQNPIANVNSKQPDKVLFDRAMDAMNHGRYDVARMSLQTLINTYPDSEYIARAKLAVGDSWYAEGGSAALAQAEIEYKDFITFFPNMPEAAEAQLKVANIHYKQMEKPDRDYTHAKRAEEEYKQLILQFPDSKLVPEAKQRLLEVQEVLAEREYEVGRFYYMRENWAAAIARLKTLADTYPLYSNADDTLYLLGSAYEHEIEAIRATKIREDVKGQMIKEYSEAAASAYDQILTRYPVMERAKDARERLEAMHRAVPAATQEAIAQNKAEEASRASNGAFGRMMGRFRRSPDVSAAAKVGEPTLVEPKEASAPDMLRHADQEIRAAYAQPTVGGSSQNVSVQTAPDVKPGPNQPPPSSSAAPALTDPGEQGAQQPPAQQAAAPAPGASTSAMPAASSESNVAPMPPTQQVNEAAGDGQGADSSTGSAAATGSSTTASKDSSNSSTESSSKSKKKKGLRKLVPF